LAGEWKHWNIKPNCGTKGFLELQLMMSSIAYRTAYILEFEDEVILKLKNVQCCATRPLLPKQWMVCCRNIILSLL
jgi:hypothetical protein